MSSILHTLGLCYPENAPLLPEPPQSLLGKVFSLSSETEDSTKYWRQFEAWGTM